MQGLLSAGKMASNYQASLPKPGDYVQIRLTAAAIAIMTKAI
jgi:hypothetical protein